MNNKVLKSSQLKYRIKEMLESLPISEYRIAKKVIPLNLGISRSTFQKYIEASIDDHYSIPTDNLALLADYFECKMEELFNFKTKPLTPNHKRRIELKRIAKKFGLEK